VKYSKCITVTGSEVSASWFRIEDISLTSSFAEYRTPVSYPAVNSKGQKVGALLSDGVAVSISDLPEITDTYYICIEMSSDYIEQTDLSLYDLYDLGKSNSGESSVLVQELPVFLNGSMVCGFITPQEKEEIFFVVMRISNINGDIQYFSETTVLQLYILASLFLICSIYGFVILAIVTVQVIMGMQEFKIQLFVVLTCLFAFNASKKNFQRIFLTYKFAVSTFS
jgi:hypothetical protein